MKQPDLILFARAPIPGQVKTRLQPHCSPAQAARVAAEMLHLTAERAASCWPADVYLCCTPGTDHSPFRQLAADLHLQLTLQAGVDLGDRMATALASGIGRRGAAAVMGCDVPHCGSDIYELAFDLLARGKEVIGLTEDGGYYLLGLQQVCDSLFENMPWGTPRVGSLTLDRARAAGRHLHRLPMLRDVDTWDDLVAVARDYPPLRRYTATP